ncbi:Hypp5646 [Branchiostoma lanceolatum]|uniref:Hypp5646 protein n=1 Tax=Branchiostoma lanceolatum TaxID=7740 RepID=A0A8J9YNJ1_BRALA|nr:Hypp5646 [Branchiostoma lanceolatum]
MDISDLQQQQGYRSSKAFPFTGLPAREYFTLDEHDREDDQASRKRQRVSAQHSTAKTRGKKRHFTLAVIAMRKALISNMGEHAYDQLDEDQLLPSPPKAVKTEWLQILGCQNFTQVTQNAREYKLVALLSKRCWDKVLHIFKLCNYNAIVTTDRHANVLMFSPLRGLLEDRMYKMLSKYADTPFNAARGVKEVIARAEEELKRDRCPRGPSMDYREMKIRLAAFQREGLTPEVAVEQRERIRNLQAQVSQLKMFILDVAQTVNSADSSETKINHIKNLLEIDPFLDPDTGGFAEEISSSTVEGIREDRTDDMSKQAPGGFGEPVSFSETQRAFSACQVFRGQVEDRLNHGKPFDNYKPLSYQAQLVAGTNYKIRVDVSGPPPQWPKGGGVGPVILRDIVEMTVYWGLPTATPELKDAVIFSEP